MKIKLQTIGNAEIEFDAVNEKSAVEALAFWQGLPNRCGICNEHLHFTFRQPQGFTYYGLECEGDPKHEATFGQHKEGGGLFFKGEWKEVQYGGYIEERNAEINKYNAPSEYAERIANGKAAIKSLGGVPSEQGRNESDKDYLESLLGQHAQLKKMRAAI